MKLINLCDNCQFATWDEQSVENAYCHQTPAYKVIGEGNYVNECSCYKCKNIIKNIIVFLKGAK